MKLEVFADDEATAVAAAKQIAAQASAAVSARNSFVMAVSGGPTPWIMLRALAKEICPGRTCTSFKGTSAWPRPGTRIGISRIFEKACLARRFSRSRSTPCPSNRQTWKMQPEYDTVLRDIAGSPPTLDLVHLGLGPDEHTASLVPGDPVLNVLDTDVALTSIYQGRRRMTLTYPAINRARKILWLVTGSEKVGMLIRLQKGDPSIPAGRVSQDRAVVFADRAAASELAV